ncbi:MAG: hypothetical protein IPL28_13770 [Chloroflexi bacterium]|nr:hypothetical protein [Chloroflexota bacterium]
MNNDFNQAPKKSSNGRIFLIIGGIFVGLCCIGALCVGGIFYTAISAIQSSDVYIDAIAKASTNTEVANVLGSPVTPGLMMDGEINVENDSGEANFNVPLEGSIQNGTLHVVASKQGGVWQYSQLYVEAADGTRIELEK